MITSLAIENFRCFESFRLDGLRPVNVLVGRNGGGKSTVLEALHALLAVWPPDAFVQSAARRDAVRWNAKGDALYELRGLFHGWRELLGAQLQVHGTFSDGAGATLALSVRPASEARRPGEDLATGLESRVVALWERQGVSPRDVWFRALLDNDGLVQGARLYQPDLRGADGFVPRVTLVPVSGVDADALAAGWEQIVLSPNEDAVSELVRTAVPIVEKVTLAPRAQSPFGGAAPLARVRGAAQVVAIAQLGEGALRAFQLGVVLASGGGTVLIDEVDTGLHHSVLTSVWRMVLRAAVAQGTQVVVTTHSRDALEALRIALAGDGASAEDVALFRVDHGLPEAVRYSGDELVAAIDDGFEVRGLR